MKNIRSTSFIIAVLVLLFTSAYAVFAQPDGESEPPVIVIPSSGNSVADFPPLDAGSVPLSGPVGLTTTPEPITGTTQFIYPPDGSTLTDTETYFPRFQWIGPADANAEWYNLWVGRRLVGEGPGGSDLFVSDWLARRNGWFAAEQVCDLNNLCTIPAGREVWLTNNSDDYEFWITYWNQSIGSGFRQLWQNGDFATDFPPPPNGPNPGLTVTTSSNAGNTVISWDKAPNTMWYQIWVGPNDYTDTSYLEWLYGEEICNDDTNLCTVSVSGLTSGTTYEVWAQFWNPGASGGLVWGNVNDGFTP